MRTKSLFAVAFAALSSLRCGGGDSSHSHPKLAEDYTSRFAGTWQGQATLAIEGQPQQSTTGTQRIDSTGFNRLSLAGMCPTEDGTAGVDSATTFSIDPLTCAPSNQPCGPVTVKYATGTGTLSGATLLLTLTGNASGCGRSLGFTLSFTGTLPP